MNAVKSILFTDFLQFPQSEHVPKLATTLVNVLLFYRSSGFSLIALQAILTHMGKTTFNS
jgi:hypothetical protein